MQAHLTDRLCIRFQQVLFLTAAISYPANGKIVVLATLVKII